MREISRFAGVDQHGVRVVIVKYRIVAEDDEITGDRMSGDPSIEDVYETLDRRPVIKNPDDTFEIAGTDQVVRKL
jgi:hypothetical protein